MREGPIDAFDGRQHVEGIRWEIEWRRIETVERALGPRGCSEQEQL